MSMTHTTDTSMPMARLVFQVIGARVVGAQLLGQLGVEPIPDRVALGGRPGLFGRVGIPDAEDEGRVDRPRRHLAEAVERLVERVGQRELDDRLLARRHVRDRDDVQLQPRTDVGDAVIGQVILELTDAEVLLGRGRRIRRALALSRCERQGRELR